MPFKSEKQRRYLFANEPEIAKKWSKEYNMGGVASMFRKRLAEGDDPFYEAWKKIYETNPDAAAMNENHDEYLEKYKLEMSMQTSEAPMEETEETTEVVEETEDPLLNLFQPTDALASDKAVTTLFTPERPEGIMTAANGGKAMKKIKGQDHMLAYITPREAETLENLGGQKTMTREGIPAYPPGENYGGGSSNDEGETSSDSGFDNSTSSNDDKGDETNREKGIRESYQEAARKSSLSKTVSEGPGSDLEKYDTPEQRQQDKYSGTTPGKVKKAKDIVNTALEKYNFEKNKFDKKYQDKVRNKIIGAVLGKGMTLGLTDVIGAVIDGMKVSGAKNDLLDSINTEIANLQELGIPDFTPHTDTPIQTLEQLTLDLTQKDKDDDDTGKDDDPPVTPITLEVDEDYAQGEMLDFNMMSALDKIRQNQAVRSGLVERGIIQDNEPMLANKGGLAGLFRVRNQ